MPVDQLIAIHTSLMTSLALLVDQIIPIHTSLMTSLALLVDLLYFQAGIAGICRRANMAIIGGVISVPEGLAVEKSQEIKPWVCKCGSLSSYEPDWIQLKVFTLYP